MSIIFAHLTRNELENGFFTRFVSHLYVSMFPCLLIWIPYDRSFWITGFSRDRFWTIFKMMWQRLTGKSRLRWLRDPLSNSRSWKRSLWRNRQRALLKRLRRRDMLATIKSMFKKVASDTYIQLPTILNIDNSNWPFRSSYFQFGKEGFVRFDLNQGLSLY